MASEVRRNDADDRYELLVDGRLVGIADFQVDGSVVEVPHAEIEPRLRGQGLGAILVKGVLDDVRDAGRTVIPSCSYVRWYIDEHPGEADLVAG
jgi:uncharacterized protein